MSLKLDQVLMKAKEKGYTQDSVEKSPQFTRPWQAESILQEPGPHTQPEITESKLDVENKVILLPTDRIINWQYHDRPETELGDIDALANDFLQIGQQQPCIVRAAQNEKYELIIGERRWRAAIKANLPLKVMIVDYDDATAALAQATENDKRKDLSDYAKGVSFARLIDHGIIKQKDLIEKLGKSKQYVSSLLSFSKIPVEIANAIGDMSKVSSRTAEMIKQLSSKGESYVQAIIDCSSGLRDGSIGYEKLKRLVENQIHSSQEVQTSPLFQKVYSSDNRHVFTWRKDNNERPSIHFPNDILNKFIETDPQLKELTDEFTKCILAILKKSAAADK